ncbi:MAG: TadE/TadG family type IV pilus assembly protein [Devosia sp.]
MAATSLSLARCFAMNLSKGDRELSRRFLADDRGVSGIEFAFVFPLILLLLVGMLETNEALTVNRKLLQVSSTVSDLIAQQSTISPAQADLTLSGAASMLTPYDTTSLKIILSVINVTATKQTIAWSRGYHVQAETVGSVASFAVPAALAVPGVQTVAVKVTYSFVSPFSSLFAIFFGTNGYGMQDFMYERPRIGDSIGFK